MHALDITRTVLDVAVALVCGLALSGCGGGSSGPTSPGGTTPGGGTPQPQICRTYSTQETRTFASSNGSLSGAINQTCNFNTSSNDLTCTLSYSDNLGANYSVTQVARYVSTADFIDEIRVVPPLVLATGGTTNYTPAGTAASSTFTFSHDAQRRQTQQVFQFSNGTTQTTTFTGWDASGRPTGATLSAPQSTTLLYAYNDAARSYAITTPSIGAVQTHTYNSDGNLVSTVSTVAGVTTTYNVIITSTGRVCR